MTVLNISKRKIYKRRRDGQVTQGSTVSSVFSTTASSGGVDPVALQDYAKKVDVHAPSQKAFLDAISMNSGYITYNGAGVSVENADKLGGVVAGSYARKDTANTFGAPQTINADLYVNGNIIHRGTAYTADFERVQVQSNLMQLNLGEVGTQITGVIPGTAIAFSGIEINRGTADSYYLGIVEGANPLIKLGKAASLVTVAARADSLTDNYMLKWDNTAKKIVQDRLVTDYWHKGNSNLSTVDWNARYINIGLQAGGSARIIESAESDVVLYYGSLSQSVIRLRSQNGIQFYNGSTITTVYHSGNSNLSTVDWEAKKILINGVLNVGSSAGLQVNGFMRTGSIYIHSGGNTPDNTRVSDFLSNVNGNLVWAINGVPKSIYHSGNANLSTVNWSVKDNAVSGDILLGTQSRITKTADDNIIMDIDYGNISGLSDYQIKIDGTQRLLVNSSGIKTTGVAKFSGTAESNTTYISGFSGQGWQIDDTGSATVDNLTVRKTMNVYELLINKIRATNGAIWVSSAMKIDRMLNHTGAYRLFINDDLGVIPFSVGDILRCQAWKKDGTGIKYYTMRVDVVGTVGGSYVYCLDTNHTGDEPEVGDDIIRIGSDSDTNRQGSLYLTSDDNNAPYMDVLDGVTSDSFVGKVKLRLGKLSGISGQSGYGIWGSRNGTEESFVISSHGYARIAGWKFDNTTLSKQVGAVDLTMGNHVNTPIQGFHVMKTSMSGGLNRVSIGYVSDDNWGIWGTSNGADTFRLGTSNHIAGWDFTNTTLSKQVGAVDLTMGNHVNTSIQGFHVMKTSMSGGLNRVSIGYVSDDNWGIWGTSNGADTFRLGTSNHIAGWDFTSTTLTGGSIVLNSNGTISNGTKYSLNNDGSGQLASSAISWNSAGVVSFSSAVSLNWSSGITAAQNTATDAYNLADTKITSTQATTITNDTIATTNVLAQNLQVEFANIQNFTFNNASGVNVDISGKISATISGLQTTILDGGNIYESVENYDTGLLSINMIGYGGGTTKYRSTRIGNGRGGVMLFCSGINDEVTVQSGQFTVDNALKVDGVSTLNNGLILAGSAIVTGGVSVTTNFVENGQLLSDKYASKYYETNLDTAVLNTSLSTYSSLYGYRNLSTHGWCRLPNGMIMNWGKEYVASNSISNTIYYKKALTEPPCTFSLTPVDTDLGNYDGWAITNETELFFKITNAGAAKYYYWVAIGY